MVSPRVSAGAEQPSSHQASLGMAGAVQEAQEGEWGSCLHPAQFHSHRALLLLTLRGHQSSHSATASQHLLPPKSFHFLISTCYKKGQHAPLQCQQGAPARAIH